MLLRRLVAASSVGPWALLLAACHGPGAAETPSSDEDPAASQAPDQPDPPEAAPTEARPVKAPTCEALPGWRYEEIDLPPEFAPSLPKGTEVLWFAPGMFDPKADDYFTYAFSLDMEDALSSPDAVESLLREYYRGLMTAVASGRDATPAMDAAVTLTDAGRGATIQLSDEFTGSGTITLHLRMSWTEGDDGCLRVLASARPTDDNWAALERSHACLCDDAPPPPSGAVRG